MIRFSLILWWCRRRLLRQRLSLLIGVLLMGCLPGCAAMVAVPPPTLPLTPTWTPFQPLPTTTSAPLPTWTPLPTVTLTLTLPPPSATPSPFPSHTATQTEIPPTPTLPPSAEVTGVVGYMQLYSLDCESRSAVDWAAFFGVLIDEDEFLSRLPLSDNPDEGFVGSVHGMQGQIPPLSYGVHAAPIAQLLRAYGLPAEERRGLTWEELQAQIAAGRPVIAWVIYGLGEGNPVSYTSASGQTTIVAAYEHTVLVIGYSPDSVTVLDGDWRQTVPVERFLTSWAVLGNMAILYAALP